MEGEVEKLSQAFWNERWQSGLTGWDVGYASPTIAEFMRQYPDKNAAILIAGCGNAYEAEFLVAQGFTNITLVDIAPEAVARLQMKFDDAAQVKVICADFFTHQGHYDLMLEQTFFCAIPPARRGEYVQHAASLLNDQGKLAGLLFDTDFGREGPPFGGSEAEYQALFAPCFTTKVMAPCYNSIPPRAGSELFIHLIKK
jgi:SAM-dependent methyltransferase